MKHSAIRNVCNAVCLAAIIQVLGCVENVRVKGLQLLLTSGAQDNERLDLPSNYIQGFLKAIESAESK